MNKAEIKNRNQQIIDRYYQVLKFSVVGREFGLSRQRVTEILADHGITHEVGKKIRLEKVVTAIETGKFYTCEEVAQEVGISASTAWQIIFEYRLKLPERPIDPDSVAGKVLGQTFNYWKVLRKSDRKTPGGNGYRHYWCQCQLCGREKEVEGAYLLTGRSKSCASCANKLWRQAKGGAQVSNA